VFDSEMRRIVYRLLEAGNASVNDCIRVLENRKNLPGKRRCLQRLNSLLPSAAELVAAAPEWMPGQPLLTR
jgi:hypothetical protein